MSEIYKQLLFRKLILIIFTREKTVEITAKKKIEKPSKHFSCRFFFKYFRILTGIFVTTKKGRKAEKVSVKFFPISDFLPFLLQEYKVRVRAGPFAEAMYKDFSVTISSVQLQQLIADLRTVGYSPANQRATRQNSSSPSPVPSVTSENSVLGSGASVASDLDIVGTVPLTSFSETWSTRGKYWQVRWLENVVKLHKNCLFNVWFKLDGKMTSEIRMSYFFFVFDRFCILHFLTLFWY